MKIDLIDSKMAAAIDKYTIEELKIPSLLLMEDAARTVFNSLIKEIRINNRILIMAAAGNNGADALAIARMLILTGYKNIDICLLGSHFTEQNLKQQEFLENINGKIIRDFKKIKDFNYDYIIDGLFGVGLSREIKGDYRDLIEAANKAKKEYNSRIYALDIPSGLDARRGIPLGAAIEADKTFSFGFEKIGPYVSSGPLYTDEVCQTPIGLNDKDKLREIGSKLDEKSPYKIFENIGQIKAVKGNILKDRDEESELIREALKTRVKGGNKGSYGKLLIVAGSKKIGGAAILSAMAAMNLGLGMVKILTHKDNKDAILTSLPEALIEVYDDDIKEDSLRECLDFADYIVLGPGLGLSPLSTKIVNFFLDNSTKPTVVDADALNIIARDNLHNKLVELSKRNNKNLIITPHLKEMERLSKIPLKEIKENMIDRAMEFSSKYNVILVLKDAKSVVSNGSKVYINQAGNDGMATAGSGDVLTGVIAAAFSYNIGDPLLTAITAVNIHANAGDLAADKKSEEGLIASDIAKNLYKIIKNR